MTRTSGIRRNRINAGTICVSVRRITMLTVTSKVSPVGSIIVKIVPKGRRVAMEEANESTSGSIIEFQIATNITYATALPTALQNFIF